MSLQWCQMTKDDVPAVVLDDKRWCQMTKDYDVPAVVSDDKRWCCPCSGVR